jgi:coproporphyrinogen III oxidase
MPDKNEITQWFQYLQDTICSALMHTDGKSIFREELWQRDGGGGGRSRVMENGNVIEKGGVNFSAVYGTLPASMQKALGVDNTGFYATGVSIVIHPLSPHVPIIHMNVRYVEMEDGVKWFGGGIDLTPHYVDEEDARYFHRHLKTVCDRYSRRYYEEFKRNADEYFFIPHRNETRGVGGIFFDRLTEDKEHRLIDRFEFVKAVGNAFAPVYTDLMNKNRILGYTPEEKQWQYLRRGRYVEFNLVYDKGTRFGLETNGRTESVLMSLPPQANWLYNYTPAAGSREDKTLGYLRKGIDWTANTVAR